MKKLLPILVIFLTSLFIAGETLSLPNCLGTWSLSSWNNCFGQYTWTNGDKWIGEWKDGEINGEGTYFYADGSITVGEWKDGEINGQAIQTWGDKNEWAGDRYVGEWKDGEMHGQGRYTFADGTIKEGIFENGKFLYANNNSNNEEILPDCPSDIDAYWHNCFGTYTLTSPGFKGDIYVGEFKNDEFHGQGTYTFSDGEKYVGEFKNDEYHGQGRYTFPNGDIYIGEFEDSKFHGQGSFYYGEKTEWAGHNYVGEFKNSSRNGHGTYTYADGSKYVGEWKDDLFNGQGKMTYDDGTSIEGIWENDEFLYATNDSTDNNNFSNDDEILPASSGSGFAVTSDGHIVTNYHVIDGCQNVEITYKGQAIPATVISFDLNNDLALLKSDFKPLYTFPLSRKNPYALMDIYVAGYPFGYDISTPVKITRGIVSSLAGIGNNFSQVQIDAAIQPGNSGGPIFDNKGNAVGVAVSKLDLEIMMDSYGVVPEGTNFGIKSNVVINFLESNNISLVNVNTKALSAEALGRMIPDGTYYISCWMTLAQIEKMRERKVLFDNLK